MITTIREQYETDGYVIARNVLDADLVREAQQHVEWLTKNNPDRRPEHLVQDLVAHDPFWVRLISDDRLLDVAVQFIGPNIALFASHYLSKPAGDGCPCSGTRTAAIGRSNRWRSSRSGWPSTTRPPRTAACA